MNNVNRDKKLELIKNLEYLVIFQNNCLSNGEWEAFDKTQNMIERIEKKILKLKCE